MEKQYDVSWYSRQKRLQGRFLFDEDDAIRLWLDDGSIAIHLASPRIRFRRGSSRRCNSSNLLSPTKPRPPVIADVRVAGRPDKVVSSDHSARQDFAQVTIRPGLA